MSRALWTHPIRVVCLVGLALFAGFASGGCAHAEYDILQPQELAQHVGTKNWVTVPMDPIEYQMIAADNHLIVRAYNRSNEPIQFVGEQSTVVDPAGQSHPLPLQNQTILPGSFIRLVLPPRRPRLAPSGPTIGIGIGGVFGSAGRFRRGFGYSRFGYGYGYHPFWYDHPRYYAVYGGGDEALYWNWKDEGRVRLVLVYRPQGGAGVPPPPDTRPFREGEGGPSGRMFSHEFAFRRVRV